MHLYHLSVFMLLTVLFITMVAPDELAVPLHG